MERYQLDENTGDRLSRDGAPEMLLQTGQTVGARRVGELGDAVWAPAAGNRTATGPLVLDRSNQLFGYIDGLEAVNVDLNDSSTLGFISGMDYYIGNLYMLDTTVSQLWRYRPTGDNYSDPREPYFPPESGTNLSTVIDAAIDGSVWLLNPNGNVVKYFGSQQEAFALESITPALSDAVEILGERRRSSQWQALHRRRRQQSHRRLRQARQAPEPDGACRSPWHSPRLPQPVRRRDHELYVHPHRNGALSGSTASDSRVASRLTLYGSIRSIQLEPSSTAIS